MKQLGAIAIMTLLAVMVLGGSGCAGDVSVSGQVMYKDNTPGYKAEVIVRSSQERLTVLVSTWISQRNNA